jgi:predicted transcriptional regulator of viral defense system
MTAKDEEDLQSVRADIEKLADYFARRNDFAKAQQLACMAEQIDDQLQQDEDKQEQNAS